MQKLLLTLLIIPTLSWAAGNQTTVCSLKNQQRTIEVVSSDKGCEVRYSKGSDSKTLWSSARNGYCAKPAADFIEKQKSWGWSCAAKADAETAAAQ